MTPRGNALDLSKVWLFSTSSAKDRRAIRKALEEVAVPPGRLLCEQGAIGLALLDRLPRSASVTSDTEMILLVLGQRQFNGILDAVPVLSRKLSAAMATRLRDADEKAYN
jgi:hypothetical protein